MGWILFIERLIAAIQECREERSIESIEAGLNNPKFLERFVLRSMLKKDGLRGHALRDKVREGMAELRDLDPEDIQELVAEALA